MRVSRWVVRPGRKNGGTVVVFGLARDALLRLTVVRVFPTCQVMGSFRVRAHAGVNRVPFRGRVRGRPLAAGTYRLIVHAEGRTVQAAEATIVVARGNTSAKKLRKARRASVCGAEEAVFSGAFPASFDPTATGHTSPGGAGSSGSSGSSGKDRIEAPVAGAAKELGKRAQALTSRFKKSVEDSAPVNALFLIAVALFVLASAAVGTVLFSQLARLTVFRDRFHR